MDIVQEIINYLPFSRKQTASGVITYCCPMCVFMGEKRPDVKNRGYAVVDSSGITIKCHNCQYKGHWHYGKNLSKQMIDFLTIQGMDEQKIKKLQLEIIRTKDQRPPEDVTVNYYNLFSEKQRKLPNNSKSFQEWANQEPIPKDFVKVVEYMVNRNQNLLEWYEFYWSPELPSRVIIPFFHNGRLIGHTSRTILEKEEPKYKADYNKNIVFGADNLFLDNRKFVIVCEGPFDAISISGVAIMGKTANEHQISMINSSNKHVIYVPDRDAAGIQMIDIAKKNSWDICLPTWKFKDCSDAVKHYGRIPVIQHIISNRITNEIMLKLKLKNWVK